MKRDEERESWRLFMVMIILGREKKGKRKGRRATPIVG